MTCLLTVICTNWKSTFLPGKWNYSQCWHISLDSWNKWTVRVSWNHAGGCPQTYLLLLAGSQSVVNQRDTRWRLWNVVVASLPVPSESEGELLQRRLTLSWWSNSLPLKHRRSTYPALVCYRFYNLHRLRGESPNVGGKCNLSGTATRRGFI